MENLKESYSYIQPIISATSRLCRLNREADGYTIHIGYMNFNKNNLIEEMPITLTQAEELKNVVVKPENNNFGRRTTVHELSMDRKVLISATTLEGGSIEIKVYPVEG